MHPLRNILAYQSPTQMEDFKNMTLLSKNQHFQNKMSAESENIENLGSFNPVRNIFLIINPRDE